MWDPEGKIHPAKRAAGDKRTDEELVADLISQQEAVLARINKRAAEVVAKFSDESGEFTMPTGMLRVPY